MLGYAEVLIYHDNGYRLTGNFMHQDISFAIDEALYPLYGSHRMKRAEGNIYTEKIIQGAINS